MREYDTIVVEKRDGIGYLIFNRPERYNAFSGHMLDEVADALAAIDADKDIRALIVTGRGKAFQAGADIRELNALGPVEMLRWAGKLVRIAETLERMRQPVIAAVNGACMGGGTEFMVACSLRVAAQSAKVALPEVTLGLAPGAGGDQRLARLVGKGRAMEIALTGAPIDAAEGYRIGLFNRVVPDGEAVKAAEELAARILANGPLGVELAKDSLERGMNMPLDEAVVYAQRNCAICFAGEDKNEGTAAFLEKRKPNFAGK